MAKDYAKTSFQGMRVRRQQRARKKLYFIVFFIVLSLSLPLGGYFLYHNPMFFTRAHVLSWIDDFKTLLHRHKMPVKSVQIAKIEPVNAVVSEPDVHFDFYTELPNMQVTLPAVQNEKSKGTQNPLTNSSKRDVLIENTQSAAKNNTSANIFASNGFSPSERIKTQTNIASAPSKSAMPSTFNTTQYVIQVGAFKSDSMASEMRISILLAGFDAKVTKTIMNDQVIYRIQQGPYSSLTRAKIAQKKLHTKGFDGIIQKLPSSPL